MIKLLNSGQITTVWIAMRMLSSRRGKALSTMGGISLAGLVIGVASLVVSMAVVSGFESTLQKSISDVSGHIQIYIRPLALDKMNLFSKEQSILDGEKNFDRLQERVKNIEPSVVEMSRFFVTEGVLAHRGRLSGIFLQGVDPDKISRVLNLASRVQEGNFDLQPTHDGVPQVLVGKGIAKDFSLKIGDEIRLVVPINTDLDASQFQRKIGVFRVVGVLDLGKYEFDQRWMFTSLSAAQSLSEIGLRYSGLLLKVQDFRKARAVATSLAHGLGRDFRVRDWKEINENLFESVRLEKAVIFFVIFLIVVAAAFNVASALYINVVRSYPEIGILKAIGASPRRIRQIFSIQGLILGVVGCLAGLLLGLLLCIGFTFLERQFPILPGSVYKLDRIDIQLRSFDVGMIVISTILVCYLATWAPSKKAAQMTSVEGLRHER